jgi:hypothetical protein
LVTRRDATVVVTTSLRRKGLHERLFWCVTGQHISVDDNGAVSSTG